MVKIIAVLIFCGLLFGCTPSSNPSSSLLEDANVNKQAQPHPGDEVAAQYNKGLSAFKPYSENPHPDLLLVDSAASGRTGVYLDGSYQFTISWIQHGGPGFLAPQIRGARLSSEAYILSVQKHFAGGAPTWPLTNYYVVADGRIELIEKTTEVGFNSAKMYETSSCHIADLREFNGKFIFGGQEDQNRQIFSVYAYSNTDQLRFTNFCRSGGGPPPIVLRWEW